MRRKKRLIVGFIGILIVIAYLIFAGMHQTTVYYLTVSELLSKGQSAYDEAVRVNREDLYVILAGSKGNGTATFKVLLNPLVNWIWIGGGVMVLGTIIGIWPQRRRKSEDYAA